GRLVAASDPGALAAAMLEVLDDPQCARRLGEAGRAWVMKNATLTAMAAGYAEIYAESHRGTGP
ncbi:MAG: glycosyltransferase, partial [Rhodanobacteraceae bacterium]